jgi:hypothetical protein
MILSNYREKDKSCLTDAPRLPFLVHPLHHLHHLALVKYHTFPPTFSLSYNILLF